MSIVAAPRAFPRAALLRALVLLHRYSADITAVARDTLGRDAVDNRAIQIMLEVSRSPGLTPSDLADAVGASRSVVSRSLGRLQDVGLIIRKASTTDGRKVTLTLTAKGSTRVRMFRTRVEDYFMAGTPLIKDALNELGWELPAARSAGRVDPLVALTRMSGAGAAYVDDVTSILQPFGVDDFAQRMALVLIGEREQVRPSHLAHELHLSSGAVSALLDRLEAAALIRRRHDLVSGDRRAVVVSLSPRGRQAVRATIGVFSRHADQLLGALTLTLR